MEIISVNNEIVKNTAKLLQKKYRQKNGKFILEGYKAIKEAFDFGIEFDYVFVEKSVASNYNFLQCNIIETNSVILKKISDTENAPNAVGVAFQRECSLEILKKSKKVVLLEGIKDAGNLGTILRSAVAFGADAIVLFGDCVDLYNPKCVRSAVGNLWKIPVFHFQQVSELEKYFGDFCRIATLPRSDKLLKEFIPSDMMLVMFGSEADGLSDKLIKYSTTSLKIEMNNNVESLNLATSVSVIIYTLF